MKLKLFAVIPAIIIFAFTSNASLAKNNKEKHHGKPHSGGLPPGLQKKQDRGGELPPGWQKKLHRGSRLDDDVYRHSTPIKREHYHRYGVRHGEIAVRVEGKIIRLLNATHTIIDILSD